MYEEIDEPIDVIAEFAVDPKRGTTKMRPVSFIWQKRDYEISEITFIWQAKEGDTKYLYFAAQNGANTYEIRYDTHAIEWRLSKIHIN